MIAKIATMRTFTKKERMQADSLPEIRSGLDDMAHRYGKVFRAGKRPASEGHFINAAVVILLGMTDDERAAALGEAFRKINSLLAIDEPSEAESVAILTGAAPAAQKETPAERVEGEGFDLKMKGTATGNLPIKEPKSTKKRDRA